MTHGVGYLLGLERADPHYEPVTVVISPDPDDKGLMGFDWPREHITAQRWSQLKEQHGISTSDPGMNQFSKKNIAYLRSSADD